MLGYSIFEADGTGSIVGRMSTQGQTFWIVALITWKIEGDKLIQTITRSNIATMKPGSSTTDIIVALDETTYEHREACVRRPHPAAGARTLTHQETSNASTRPTPVVAPAPDITPV